VLIVVAAVVLAGLALLALRPRLEARRREREQHRARLAREVAGHREEASTRGSSAADAAREAEAHRRVAADHVAKAQELEDDAARAQRAAAFHEQRARESGEELER